MREPGNEVAPTLPKTRGAFHYAKDSGNFGRNSNRKIRFSFFLTGIFGITSGGGPHISVGIPDRNFHFSQTGSLPLLGNSVTKFK